MYHITSEQIETFINLARKKNFRQVSEDLYITQPTVTKHIQKLEKELGIKLFIRTKTFVELTEEGRILLDTWHPLYTRFLDSINEVHEKKFKKSDQISIGFLRDYYGEIQPRNLVTEFNLYLKEMNLKPLSLAFQFLDMKEQRSALKNNFIDFSLSLGFDYNNIKNITSEAIIRQKIFAILPKGHHLAHKKSVSIYDLSEETFVILSPSESFEINNITSSTIYRYLGSPSIRIKTNLKSLTFSILTDGFVTLGNKSFFNSYDQKEIVEIPIKELSKAGYDETLAYSNTIMNEKKKIFLDFMVWLKHSSEFIES